MPRIGIEQEVIWMTVEIKVRHTRHVPAGPSSGPERVADAHVIVKIPYRCVPRIGIEQEVIWMTVEIKVRHTRHAPAGPSSGPNAWPTHTLSLRYHIAVCPVLDDQEVIWMTVEIKVRHTHHIPAGPRGGPERVADAHVIVKIPYRRLPRIGIE